MKTVILLVVLVAMLLLVGCPPSPAQVRGDSQKAGYGLYRTAVPNGWIVTYFSNGVTFVPDPDHQWQIGQRNQ